MDESKAYLLVNLKLSEYFGYFLATTHSSSYEESEDQQGDSIAEDNTLRPNSAKRSGRCFYRRSFPFDSAVLLSRRSEVHRNCVQSRTSVCNFSKARSHNPGPCSTASIQLSHQRCRLHRKWGRRFQAKNAGSEERQRTESLHKK